MSGSLEVQLVCEPGAVASRSDVEAALARIGVRALSHAPRQQIPSADANEARLMAGVVIAVVQAVDSGSIAWVRSCRSWWSSRMVVLVASSVVEINLRDGLMLLDAGADDVVTSAEAIWPDVVRRLVERWQTIESAIADATSKHSLIGSSSAWMRVVRDVAEASMFGRSPILLTGETGTGKDLLARFAHELNPRAKRDTFAVVDCASLTRDLAGSELFGHERGAFTGASAARTGAVALADGGTLFLDEVGELSLELQAPLLRLLQERVYKSVGSDLWRRSDFRLISATNRDLRAEVRAGRFREDLYHRLASVVCRAPSLRERRHDVPLLAEHFLSEAMGTVEPPPMAAGVREYLGTREYPGNVRELRQLTYALARRYAGCGPITIGTIPEIERPALPQPGGSQDWRQGESLHTLVDRALADGTTLKELSRVVEEVAIQSAIRHQGTLRAAAGKLGLTERALQLRRASQRRADDQESA